ncbi:nucleoid-structuring protein H-NS [candidate division WOR-1 bacterium RIFOXYB2_FULL_42_35]|uniref:Nucleoid-structuring protein H-NS n=1 Tax=candidate division WOR-1 bacterium RIFOXYC2_FULL_41_25 TaxID=1802586 RepID=A0A1F4TJ86_UNCSA|nr:MAG: nucleoid-structuring protein H-NS [candidate division WOR-1 bacterium RIFOXYA2_FULL_41_14]OGC21967.1 MAG: nucleoid-structuring protein H-NS [candidate division WOR-1 bacterium RIFOXYB2_FULL_42_35]OGC32801.1 MAG: nucleoid-structuring protein H-NS [candidate division WOR-1 bacterium RIFOXYC2_FULL_41_25]OGC43388.1 MAG: nucleoid-structuring protein H-NS [candidate division WOR-1 bacterium RIFOXYD2_FULL_41_8]
MYRPEIKVLDCTIRDGGLINDHNFEDGFVKAVFTALAASGVDYVELGYRNSDKIFSPDKFGKWKFCDEKHLKKIVDGIKNPPQLTTMVDIGRVDLGSIPKKKDSVVDVIRVACYVKDIDKAIDLTKRFTDKGYKTTVNVMAISTALQPALEEGLSDLSEAPIMAVYIVDSFGALYSEQVHFLVNLYKKYLNPKGIEVGFHAHNNQQLGFANTIEAIRKGANYLDATIYGIGRAAGNCPLELLLSFLKNPKFNLEPVLEVIEKEFLPLRKEIEWGYILPYMITGVLNRHPKAAMAFRKTADKDKSALFYRDQLAEEDAA